jgi:hypothetical protein
MSRKSKMMTPEVMAIGDIVRRKPFDGLFPMYTKTICAIEANMSKHGYDQNFPLLIWRGENVCVDGNQRLYVANFLRIKEVPVIFMDFESEQAALEYALHVQRDRRNITDADIFTTARAIDDRMTKSEAGSRGGKQTSSDVGLNEKTYCNKIQLDSFHCKTLWNRRTT